MAKVTTSNLSEWLDESVVSNLGPVIKENKPFIVPEDNKPFYYGMMLDTEDIGGITKKSRNKDYIGGLIEGIKGSRVDALVTKELNADGKILFIPTSKTLSYIGEYGIYTKKNYEFVKLNGKFDVVERTGIKATYAEFRQIACGETDITEYIKPAEPDVIVKGSAEDPTIPHGVAATVADAATKVKDVAAKAASAVVPGAANVFGAIKDKMQEVTGVKDMVGDKKPVEEAKPATQAPVEEKKEEKPAEKAAPPPEPEEDVYYSETQIMTSMERIFHADNLDLPVSSDPFDQLFTLNNHLIRFDIDSRDTYVNERLNIMAADANRDLQKLRNDNLKKLREKYFMLMSLRVMEIQRELDIADQSTDWGAKKWSIEDYKREQYSKMPSLVEDKRNQLEEKYQQRLNDFCDAAMKEARNQYNNRYQVSHNQEMGRVEAMVRADIDAEYNKQLNDLYTARRNDALTLLDLNITGVLNELTTDYKAMFEAENALYVKRADEMREYVKELHAEDAKRLAIEEERNRISNEVNDARAEAAAKIELIKKEYETAQAALEARSEATISKAQNETILIKDQMESRTATLEQDKERLQKQLDEAIERADKAQEAVRADYEHRLAQAQDDRDSWKQTLDSYKEQHRHNNMLAAILVIAVVIAAIAGGFVAGGVYWNRIVAGELSSNQDNVAINIINPEETTTLSTGDELVTDADITESDSSTTVPADEEQASVTTTTTEENDADDIIIPPDRVLD